MLHQLSCSCEFLIGCQRNKRASKLKTIKSPIKGCQSSRAAYQTFNTKLDMGVLTKPPWERHLCSNATQYNVDSRFRNKTKNQFFIYLEITFYKKMACDCIPFFGLLFHALREMRRINLSTGILDPAFLHSAEVNLSVNVGERAEGVNCPKPLQSFAPI